MSSSDIQALFSNLRPRSRDPSSNQSTSTTFAQPRPVSASFLSNSHVPSTPPPPFSTTAEESTSHAATRGGTQEYRASSGATAQNLLNLLNHGGTSGVSGGIREQSPAPHHPTNISISASDLVARFMSPTGSNRSEIRLESATHLATGTGQSETQTSRNPLLELLNRHSTASASSRAASQRAQTQENEGATSATPVLVESIKQETSSTRQSDRDSEPEVTPFEIPTAVTSLPPADKPIFTYQNPFEALQASRGQTPKASNPVPLQPTTPSFQFASQSSSPAAISARKKLTPKLRSTPSGALPQVDFESQSPEATPAPQATADAVSEGDLPIREKQPTVETPDVAQSIEMVEDTHLTAQDTVEISNLDAVKDTQDGSGEWEDVPDKTMSEDNTVRVVPVFNFPIKAFVSITLNLGITKGISIRDEGVMEISRMKKDFDQLDRSLAAATSRYITYAFTKTGGLRIIRQDDGSDRHVFKSTHDRIFNVSFCTAASSAPLNDNQAVLGTGISGTVYYATVSKAGNDLFEKNQLESESLIFPPWPHGDENTAGGVLKTRAKKSSRHPEFFAVGRGKSIHFIWPATAMSPRYGISETNRAVDVEKLYEDRPLQISTGKAGKDFTFSEDDTMIVSLDKTGRLRFWDIRTLIDESNATAPRVKAVNIDTPVLSLSTASPAEKSWPTSVLFVDKARPYNKGGAQRYVLVGLRQNHTLQLWDIALGKAVQEISFPHESETDGICSVNYHPSSGIIVVGHPTRNSIFFIHLSAPRYTLGSTVSQADYVTRSAAKDASLPKPESTACMSGIREISFMSKGELRSIELLPVQKDSSKATDESTSVFELYIVHSRGVTCLGINKEDLGWNADSKVIQSIDALKEGVVTVKDLKLGSVIEEAPRSKSPVKEIQQPVKTTKKKAKKAGQQLEEVNGIDEQQSVEPIAPANGLPDEPLDVVVPDAPVPEQDPPILKESKKAKKKAAQAAQAAENAAKAEVRTVSPTKSLPVQPNGTNPAFMIDSAGSTIGPSEQMSVGISSEQLDKEMTRMEQAISGSFKSQLDTLYQNIQADRSAQDQISNSRQEAILRLVSDSLNNNVEKSLTRIVSQQIQQSVIPVVAQSVSAEVGSTLAKSLYELLPQEIGKHLSNTLSTVLQSPHMTRVISDSVSHKLGKHLESQMTELLSTTVTPLFKNIALSAAERATADTEDRLTNRIHQLELLRATDNDKIDNLSQVLQGMAGTLQAMSNSQVAFQEQILKDRRDLGASESGNTGSSRQVSTVRVPPSPIIVARPIPVKVKTKEELELEEITGLMSDDKYEEATIKWLQSPQSAALFDEVFIRFTPDYLATDVSPLVAFSVAVTVGNALNTNVERRMEWISSAFDSVDASDPELVDLAQHAPALISSLIQKLESLYMTLAEHDPNNAVLRAIPALARKARDMKASFVMSGAGADKISEKKGLIESSLAAERNFSLIRDNKLRVRVPKRLKFVKLGREDAPNLRSRLFVVPPIGTGYGNIVPPAPSIPLKERGYYWWMAQGIHYGITPRMNKSLMQDAFRTVMLESSFRVPKRLLALEKELRKKKEDERTNIALEEETSDVYINGNDTEEEMDTSDIVNSGRQAEEPLKAVIQSTRNRNVLDSSSASRSPLDQVPLATNRVATLGQKRKKDRKSEQKPKRKRITAIQNEADNTECDGERDVIHKSSTGSATYRKLQSQENLTQRKIPVNQSRRPGIVADSPRGVHTRFRSLSVSPHESEARSRSFRAQTSEVYGNCPTEDRQIIHPEDSDDIPLSQNQHHGQDKIDN